MQLSHFLLRTNATFVENKRNFLIFLLRIIATFVENKCNFLIFLLQQKLALIIRNVCPAASKRNITESVFKVGFSVNTSTHLLFYA